MPKIAVLLATYNGGRFLSEQLNSIFPQNNQNWSLYISDDGSTDNTRDVIREFIRSNSNSDVNFLKGPRKGYVENFIKLLEIAEADYFFFCDQDDVWLPCKLYRYFNFLPDPSKPALICARTKIIDEMGKEIGLSPLFSKSPNFGNALVQSIAGGNTMAMTRAARDIVLKATELPGGLVSHDWWFYQVLSGAGAKVIYDPTPSVLYRQHPKNLIGENTSLRAKWHRLRLLINGQFSKWSNQNIENLLYCRASLTKENRAKLDHFIEARKSGLIRRIWLMRKCGVYRQTTTGNIALWIAIILNKI